MAARAIRISSAGSMRPGFLWALLLIIGVTPIAPSTSDAQVPPLETSITPTGGTGDLVGTQVLPPDGNVYGITGGKPIGTNLFHSFGEFTIRAGDTAQFQTSDLSQSLSTTNIIGRVTTSGSPSSIFGTIDSETFYPAANLFLMNPSGFVFGPTASLNVGGAVSFTTAQYIRLFDGVGSANFHADPANDTQAMNSILTIDPLVFSFLDASPAAYGFLTAPVPNATITVQGHDLSAPLGQSISFVGGKVVIEGEATLTAPSGRIHLAATASPGEFASLLGESLANATILQAVPHSPSDPTTAFTSYGLVSMAPGSSIDVHGPSTVWIKGGQLVLSVNEATLSTSENSATSDSVLLGPGSAIVTSKSGADPGADVQITVGNLQADGTTILSTNTSDRDGANISINATEVGLTNGSSITSITGLDLVTGSSQGSGNGGKVMVQGLPGAADNASRSVTLSNGSVIVSQTSGPGFGGDVQITTDQLNILNGSGFFSVTAGGGGVGGNLVLNVGDLSLSGGDSISQIQSFSSNLGTDLDGDGDIDLPGSPGGTVTIQGTSPEPGSAANRVELSGGSQISSQTEGSGDGGTISVKTADLTLSGNASILSSTGGTGHGGSIELTIREGSLSSQAAIISRTSANGSGGGITIQGLDGPAPKAVSLRLADAGTSITSSASGTGRLGDIEIHAKTVDLMNEAVILAGSEGDTASTAGNVTIDAVSVRISGGSAIASQVFTANAGTVSIAATNHLTLDDGSITTSTSGPGRAGDVELEVGNLTLTNGSRISSASAATVGQTNGDGTTTPPGAAGNITIKASGNFTSNAGTITTSAEANHGGDISISAQNIRLTNGTLINANSNAPLIVTQLVLDPHGQLIEQVMGNGNAGNISFNSKEAPGKSFEMFNSRINTSAALADGGNIEIYTTNMARMTDSTIISSVGNETISTTKGGNITIDPDFVILKLSQIRANAFAGTGGAIDITSGLFLADSSSIVDASSTQGISGTVQINAPINNLSSVVGRLPESLVEVQTLLRAACAARMAQGGTSSFVEHGRDSIPAGPEGLLASPYLPVPSGHLSRWPATPSRELPDIQVRRLSGQASPAPATILSEHAACSS